eukprot:COSAG06_NODE_29793_length_550_cov_0.931264_1_plen_83_part_10
MPHVGEAHQKERKALNFAPTPRLETLPPTVFRAKLSGAWSVESKLLDTQNPLGQGNRLAVAVDALACATGIVPSCHCEEARSE